MSPPGNREPERIAQLRRAFDESFAAPPLAGAGDPQALLLIRAGGEIFALRVAQIAGLLAARRIVPVPSRHPELLGIAGAGGAPVAVFDLGALLRRRASGTEVQWLALAGRDAPVALSFQEIEGQIEVAPAGICDGVGSVGRGAVRQMVRTGSSVFPIVDLTAVVDRIRSLTGSREPAKE